MSLRTLIVTGVLAGLVLTSSATAQNTKGASDQLVHWIRAKQNADGTYGAGLADTCRVLDVLGRSPRRYTELDGPFFRVAAQRVAEAKAGDAPDSLVVLALAGTVTSPMEAARKAALSRLTAALPGTDYDTLLALRTFPPEGESWPAVDSGADAGLQCLAASEPAAVTPPDTANAPAWTRWARAARLRGLMPVAVPALPSIDGSASLPALIASLETVIQMHGLTQPTADDDDEGGEGAQDLPATVTPGGSLDVALTHAMDFLEKHQNHGRFGLDMEGWEGPEPGVTALCLSAAAFAADHRHQPHPAWLNDGLDYLVSLQKPDGSIHQEGLDVYTTSVAIEALIAGGRATDKPVIERARNFLITAQADEGEGYDPRKDPLYGGIGYGDGERPDLSNTQMALEAAAQAGTPPDHVFFRKARQFLENCQNYSEGGARSWPRPGGGMTVAGNDGGGTYMPGNSAAGDVSIADGVYQPRSYGSMTYALAKSYLFCGAPADDPRLAAAVRWLAGHFTVATNPGFAKPDEGTQGLFYYYLTLGRTLRLLPPDGFKDGQGAPIAWREALTRKLLDEQRIDGSWINAGSPRWWEGAPTLCTAYALLSLQAAES